MARALSIFPWYGGKASYMGWLLPLLPEATTYVEPFAGAAAVLLNRPPAKNLDVLNDLNGRLVHLFRTLRECPEELQLALALTPTAREEYSFCVEDDPSLDDVERARRTYTMYHQMYGGGGQEAVTGWRRHTNGKAGKCQYRVLMDKINRLGVFVDRLRNVQIENRDAIKVIQEYGRDPVALLYCDPPYTGAERAGIDSKYKHDMDDAEQRRFLQAVVECPARVAVSGYRSPLYDEYIGHWRQSEKGVMNRTAKKDVRADGNYKSSPRTEILWMNYDPEGEVEQYDFLN